MKVWLTKLLCFTLLLSFVLSATSCQQKNDDNADETDNVKVEAWDDELISSDPENAEYEYFFDSVEALQDAIKYEPDKYNGANIKIIGTIYQNSNGTFLADFTATSENVSSIATYLQGATTGDLFLAEYEFRKTLSSCPKISIIITNDAQYAVAETGDYVKVYGTVSITRDSIYIGNCEYKLIASLEKRMEMVADN